MATNVKEIREIYIFAVVLVIQSLPFIAAVTLAVIERTRFNDFATWRALDARLGELLPKRAQIAKATTAAPVSVPVHEQGELVQ